MSNNIIDNIFSKFKKAKTGTKAPFFIAEDINRKEFDLQDRLAKRVLLSFFPMAWRESNAIQIKELGQNHSRLGRYGILPIGISTEPVLSLKNWKKYSGIGNVKLLSDFYPHGDISKKYNVFNKQTGRSKRANILINQENKIIYREVYAGRTIPEVEEILEFIKNFRKE